MYYVFIYMYYNVCQSISSSTSMTSSGEHNICTLRIGLITSLKCIYIHIYIHEKSLQEMLRKARQQQHNRKAKQHNTTPRKSFFKENWLPRVGLKPTTISNATKRCSYQLSYGGSSCTTTPHVVDGALLSCVHILYTCVLSW